MRQVFIGAGVVLALILAILAASANQSSMTRDCQERGGTLVRAVDGGLMCVRVLDMPKGGTK